jgi:hypothetical protein
MVLVSISLRIIESAGFIILRMTLRDVWLLRFLLFRHIYRVSAEGFYVHGCCTIQIGLKLNILSQSESQYRESHMKNPSGSIIKLSNVEPVFRHCQWLYGDGVDRNFCRSPVARGEIWCRDHLEIVYMPRGMRERKFEKLSKKSVSNW